jgi:hypothetical protein
VYKTAHFFEVGRCFFLGGEFYKTERPEVSTAIITDCLLGEPAPSYSIQPVVIMHPLAGECDNNRTPATFRLSHLLNQLAQYTSGFLLSVGYCVSQNEKSRLGLQYPAG